MKLTSGMVDDGDYRYHEHYPLIPSEKKSGI